MRLAVLSDMHGNDVAFEAALADLDRQGFDQIVCLGDAVQGGPQPAEVVGRLRERKIPVVMGNADAWLLTGVESGAEEISNDRIQRMLEVREWSLSRLSAADKEFIASFVPTITIDHGNGQKTLCYHGSPLSFDDVLLPDAPIERFQELLPLEEATYFTGGHTHVQFLRHLGHGFHFNPGSVGAAYRHNRAEFRLDPYAEYAVLTVDGPRVGLEFRRIPFDVDRLMDVYRTCGRPFADLAVADYGL